jgi:23S rRNA (cytidine1920-2'-O)/16S rRNA (cytidine1409-2'-O)-methyltransferase
MAAGDRLRLDIALVQRGLVASRSQAESWIKLGKVMVDGKIITKPGFSVFTHNAVTLDAPEQYVSRAGLKLASVSQLLGLDFAGKTVLDVGSSTGGFTDYALQHGAKKVYAVDVGTEQLHPKLRRDSRVELYEKTDISTGDGGKVQLSSTPDIVVIDVSFISLREVLPHIAKYIAGKNTEIVAMVKPQFEAGKQQVNKGIIKNDTVRRAVLKDFEAWARRYFIVKDKADSEVVGGKGNRERFYRLRPL